MGEIKRINGKRVASPEYRSWQMMKNRCLNPNAADYAYYGGRGIKISVFWVTFEGFLADMGRRPAANYTLERKNTAYGYSKDNCCWATRKEQSRNRAFVKLDMKQAQKIRKLYASKDYFQYELAELFGVSRSTISLITRCEAWI